MQSRIYTSQKRGHYASRYSSGNLDLATLSEGRSDDMGGIYSYKSRRPFHKELKDFGLGFCPVTLFLALAFMDTTFAGDLTLEKLLSMKDARIYRSRSLSRKTSTLNKPVFRQQRNGKRYKGSNMWWPAS